MKKYLLAAWLWLWLLLNLCGCNRFQPSSLKSKKQSTIVGCIANTNIAIKAYTIFHEAPSPVANDLIKHANLLSLHITNKTKAPISINPIKTIPHIMQSKEFAEIVPQSYGCYFIPATLLSCTGIVFLWQVGLPLAGLLTLFGINQSRKAAARTIASFNQHALGDDIKIIPALSSKTFLIAIKHTDYQPEINLSLTIKGKEERWTLHLKKTIQKTYIFS